MGRRNDTGNPNAPFAGYGWNGETPGRKHSAPHIVRIIVGRRHVGESNRRVIRYFISRLKAGYATWKGIPRAERRQWLRWVIEVHAENRGLYNYVMGGGQ